MIGFLSDSKERSYVVALLTEVTRVISTRIGRSRCEWRRVHTTVMVKYMEFQKIVV